MAPSDKKFVTGPVASPKVVSEPAPAKGLVAAAHSLVNSLERSVAHGASLSIATNDAISWVKAESGYVSPVAPGTPGASEKGFFSTAS